MTAAVSVISKHRALAISGSPTVCRMNSANDCSFSEVPERFTASIGNEPPASRRRFSNSTARTTTQRSMIDMTL